MSNNILNSGKGHIHTAVDITIKLGALFILLMWCFQIIRPFIYIMFWAMVISVTLFPLYNTLSNKIGDRKKIASLIITIILLSILIVPSVVFTESLVQGVSSFAADIDADSFEVPPPPESVAEWPVVGKTIYGTWLSASENLQKVIISYSDQLKAAGKWLLEGLVGTGMGIVQLLLSIILSGIFLVYTESGGDTMRKFFVRVVGERGEEFFQSSVITIRNVSKGVLGVALIQALLAGVIFLIAGVPYAGLWALLALIFCIIQIGPAPVIIPVIIYIFTVVPTWQAVLWAILLVFVMLVDNLLKPMLMGKGAPVPMLVIFMGSIGGFMAAGFVGLFLGAIVLSLGYKLFLVFINEPETEN